MINIGLGNDMKLKKIFESIRPHFDLKIFLLQTLIGLSFYSISAYADSHRPDASPLVNTVETIPNPIQYQNGDRPQFTFPLNIYVDPSTGWSHSQIQNHIKRVQEIFKVCDLEASPVNLLTISLPAQYHDFGAPRDEEIVQMLSPVQKPSLFFLGGSTPPQAYGDEFAAGSPRGALIWTAWLSPAIIKVKKSSRVAPEYDSVAHEVAHLLCDCDHTSGPQKNLLAGEADYLSDQLTTGPGGQCEAFQKSPLVKKRAD